MTTWRDDIIRALEQKGGVAGLSEIYELVKSYRTQIPPSYQAMIRGTIETASRDSKVWDKKNDLFYSVEGIGGGVWGLKALEKDTPLAVDVADPSLDGGTLIPGKVLIQTYRIVRDTKLCRDIKQIHNYECQICELTINLPNKGRYAEAHHIIPLGSPHFGADVAKNIIVVCPNHHAMLDYGVIKLEPALIINRGKHEICPTSIAYHNVNIYGEVTQQSPLENVLEAL